MEIQLEGWDQLSKALDQLGARAQKNILRGMVRNEANYLAQRVQERAPLLQPSTDNPHGRYIGQLRDAVTAVSLNPSATPGAVAAGVRVRGSRDQLSAMKTAGRALGKGAKGLKGAAKALQLAIADGYYWRWVEYGSPHNEPPMPFIRNTWDEQKAGCLVRMADYCRDRLDKLTHD